MDLSVVIPARNEARYIAGCLEALGAAFTEARVEAETIVVDNGSDDDTALIAAMKGARVVRREGGTIAELRNAGAASGSGRLLAFLDADCLVDPRWVLLLAETLCDPSVVAVGTPAVPHPDQATWVTWAWFALAAGAKRGDEVPWLGTSNLMVRRHDFKTVGGFDSGLATAEDVDLSYRLRKLGRIRLEKRISTFHVRDVTTLYGLFQKEMWRGKSGLQCLARNGFRPEEFPSVLAPAVNAGCAVAFLAAATLGSWWVFLPVIGSMLLPAMLILRKGALVGSTRRAICIYIISFVFITARSVALFYEITALLVGFFMTTSDSIPKDRNLTR